MKTFYIKNKNSRILYDKIERKKLILNYLFKNNRITLENKKLFYLTLAEFPKNASKSRISTRCIVTNRSKSVYKKMKLSRIMFKKFAAEGALIGIKRASW